MNPDDVDFCEKYNKKVIPAENSYAFLPSQGAFLLGSWLFAFPISVVSTVGKLITGGRPSKSIGSKKFEFPKPISSLCATVVPLEEREFDIVVFGATGFAGNLAAKYLAERYGNKVKWAIAGRRRDALEKLQKECYSLNKELKSLPIIEVDSSNEKSLHEMCARTKVVVTTVGPFQLYGTPLVRACLSNETTCCDITGEADWHQGLIDSYDSIAREKKVKIVSFCGHDCIPWELSTYILAKKLGEEKMDKIDFYDEVDGNPSGGTIATIIETVTNPGKYKPKTKFSPTLLDENGNESQFKAKSTSSLLPTYTPLKSWAGMFVMEMVNAEVVRRSNALNGYGKSLKYSEARLGDSFSTVLGRYLQLMALGPILFLPESLQFKIIPEPGQGPTKQQMDRGFLQVTGIATGEKGTKVGSRMYFNTDAGYRDTARMLVEVGLSIALSPEKCLRAGGVLTPATCCPEVLFERLLQTGTQFSYLSPKFLSRL